MGGARELLLAVGGGIGKMVVVEFLLLFLLPLLLPLLGRSGEENQREERESVRILLLLLS